MPALLERPKAREVKEWEGFEPLGEEEAHGIIARNNPVLLTDPEGLRPCDSSRQGQHYPGNCFGFATGTAGLGPFKKDPQSLLQALVAVGGKVGRSCQCNETAVYVYNNGPRGEFHYTCEDKGRLWEQWGNNPSDPTNIVQLEDSTRTGKMNFVGQACLPNK